MTVAEPVVAPVSDDEIAEAGIVCRDLTKIYSGVPPAGSWSGGGRPAGPPGGARPQRVPGEPVRAVDRLNLVVRRGELFGLLGPNGAGKSTTIGMLTTRVIPTSGQAFVDGVDVVKYPPLARTRLAAVTQTNTLDRSLTVFDNLYFHGRYFGLSRGESRRRAHELIERFGLQDKARAMVDTLSGGLAQRVQIARALLHRPAVLFLDEPTAGLDPQARLNLWEAIRAERDRGATVVLTTHYLEEAERLCDRVAILEGGRIVALASPRDLIRQAFSERAIVFRSDALAREELLPLPAVREARARDGEWTIYSNDVQATTRALLMLAAERGLLLEGLAVREASLEDVYLQITGRTLRD